MRHLIQPITGSLAAAAAVMVSLAWAPLSQAAVPEEEQQTLQLMIETRLEKAVGSLIQPKSVAEQLFLEWPVKPPTANPEEIEAEVAARVTELGAIKFADRTDDYFMKLALERYPEYRNYQARSVTLRNGEVLAGTIREIEATYIVIANTKVQREDLSDESLIHFDPTLAAQKKEAYVRLKKAETAEERKQYEQDIRTDVEREAYTTHGYIQIKGEWKPQIVYFEERIASLKHRERERLRGSLTVNVYYENGYVLYKGEWMTPPQRDAMIQAEARGGTGARPATTTGTTPPATGDANDLFNE